MCLFVRVQVKRNISQIRSNTTQSIWTMSHNAPLFNQTNWTSEVVDMLKVTIISINIYTNPYKI